MRYRFLALALVMGSMGCKGSVDHDEISAAKSAVEFADVAFVQRDFERGYALLSDSGKRYVSPEKFKETLSRLHPKAFPVSVTASEYEPMRGEKAMHLYLTGENSGERFYYRLTMEGAATTGYRVARFYRESNPYPGASLRQRLKESPSTRP
ncbi:MAG: hypothetical protein E6J89_10820 [Deltaproteobacteria bacterium]|nr:MAG: hypothetical protein E6J89_10820 [Deltaproteobacteria bacterium]